MEAIDEEEEDFEVWYQHDGAPAHTAQLSCQTLANLYGEDHLISNNLRINWPARIPDLAPCDCFLWPYLGQQLYHGQAYPSLEVLMAEIRMNIEQISTQTYINVTNEFYDWLGYCSAANGEHFEKYL